MPELTITLPYVHSRVDSNTFYHGQPYARVDFIPQSGTLALHASGPKAHLEMLYAQYKSIFATFDYLR